MKFTLKIECEICDNLAEFVLKRTTNENEGRIYEDYSSIEDGIGENPFFSASISPDTVNIKCKKCSKFHELTI